MRPWRPAGVDTHLEGTHHRHLYRMLRHSATSGSDIHVDVDRSSWSRGKTDACCTAGVGVACWTLCCKAD